LSDVVAIIRWCIAAEDYQQWLTSAIAVVDGLDGLDDVWLLCCHICGCCSCLLSVLKVERQRKISFSPSKKKDGMLALYLALYQILGTWH